MQLAATLGLQIEAEFGIILCSYLALCYYLFAEDPNGAVTTFRAGSTFNVTFHLAYPHRVSTTRAVVSPGGCMWVHLHPFYTSLHPLT